MKVFKIFLIILSVAMMWIGRRSIMNTAVQIPILRRTGVRVVMRVPYFRKRMLHSMFSDQ